MIKFTGPEDRIVRVTDKVTGEVTVSRKTVAVYLKSLKEKVILSRFLRKIIPISNHWLPGGPREFSNFERYRFSFYTEMWQPYNQHERKSMKMGGTDRFEKVYSARLATISERGRYEYGEDEF